MQYLLDMHIILWVESDSPRLSAKIKAVIGNISNECFVSIASLWEMSIKISSEKLSIDISFLSYLADNNFKILEVSSTHLNTLLTLPLHHKDPFARFKDPFDRLLIAQAITENFTLISADQYFNAYPINLLQ
ncbi:MAG: type II toxin-antitoxin system VapC family toxin [Janthinobacterium lividum]